MKTILRELGWLLGCLALSFAATGALLGYRTVLPGGVLDVQLHNTYFVIGWWTLLLPLFLAAAVPLTLARAAQAGGRRRGPRVVLAGLALLTLPVLLLGGLLLGYWVGLWRP